MSSIYSERDWPEDFEHENGQYMCRCHECENTFIGYKRRVTCKVCANKHPEQAEGAQGERERFEAWYERTYGMRAFEKSADHSYVEPYTEMQWAGWQARAALAKPSPSYAGFPKPTVLKYCDVRYAANASSTAVNPGAQLPGCINAQPSPAPELERPDITTKHGYPAYSVAQHERIVGALRAEIEEVDGLAKRLDELLRQTAIAMRGPEPALTRYGYADLPQRVKTLLGERDAAQSRLAELEKQEPVAMVKNRSPGCVSWSKYGLKEGTLLYADPVAQAGQVPDVSAMARVLSDRQADACNVDRDDQWKLYGNDFIEDVKAMLAAAPSQGGE